MTALYSPADPKYFDKAHLNAELDRVFDLCHGCRLCFNLCPSFPTLFDFVDDHDGDAAALTQAERDQVVDECYQCKLCYVKCPYVPPHEWKLDFPRLMMRVHANRKREGVALGERVTDQLLGRTDLLGAVSSAAAPIVNRLTGAPGSLSRRAMERATGMAAQRLLPPYARQRFTTWFKRRRRSPVPTGVSTGAQGTQTTQGIQPAQTSIFPTCFIEYMDPSIGRDLVQVFERNGVECSIPAGSQCCGAPWLHSGNVAEFERAARRNVAALAREVRAGRDVIVAQPTCAYVLKRDYPLYLGSAGDGRSEGRSDADAADDAADDAAADTTDTTGSGGAEAQTARPESDAELVARHTFDPAEYLMRRHRSGETLDLEFPGRRSGAVPDRVTYHVSCHLQAQNMGLKSRDLLKLAGITCDLVQRCSGIDGTWGYRAEHYEMARKVAAPMAREIRQAGNDVVCGDCLLANGSIRQETGLTPLHPIQVLARAYGIAEVSPGPGERR